VPEKWHLAKSSSPPLFSPCQLYRVPHSAKCRYPVVRPPMAGSSDGDAWEGGKTGLGVQERRVGWRGGVARNLDERGLDDAEWDSYARIATHY